MLLAKTSAGVIVTNPEDRLTLEKNLWNADRKLIEIPIGSNIKANLKLQTPNSKMRRGANMDWGNDLGDRVISDFKCKQRRRNFIPCACSITTY